MDNLDISKTKTSIAVAGSVDSGKSSFIGVLVSGKLDDGNGSARVLVAKHKHEIESGKTSDISTRNLTIPEKNSSVSIVDLCGHEKFFNTTSFGIMGYFTDYAFLIISANNSTDKNGKILPMTEQHLKMLVTLSIPIMIIVTHVDIAPKNVYAHTLKKIRELITLQCGKTAKCDFINNAHVSAPYDTEEYKQKIKNEIVSKLTDIQGRQLLFPIISMSNKTGYYVDVVLDIVKELSLSPRNLWPSDNSDISNNIIIKFFGHHITQKIYENTAKYLIINIIEFIELKNIITTILNIVNKEKNKQENILTIISKLWHGKIDLDKIITQTLKDNGKNNNYHCVIFDVLKNNENDITDTEIRKILFTQFMKKTLDIQKNDIISNSIKYIMETNIVGFDKIFNALYDNYNEELYNKIKNYDGHLIVDDNVIKPLLDSINLQTIVKNLVSNNANNIIYAKNIKYDDNSIYYINNCYNKPGIGLVVSGINRGKKLNVLDKMFIGPIIKDFVEFKVKSIHNDNSEDAQDLIHHERGCIALSLTKKNEIKRKQIRKGTIIVSSQHLTKNICFRFKALITISSKSVSIRDGYSPVINMNNIRQSARILINPDENDGNNIIGFNSRGGNIAVVTFKFICHAEYVEPYTIFIFKSGDIHGFGVVIQPILVENDPDAKPDKF